jgi:DNA-binding transcriptional LysR family regulator
MNLRQLEIFRSVIRHSTTVGAAQELGISQPAVSNSIKQLEDQLGFLLFDRSGNRLMPRQEATILYGKSEGVFLLSRDLDQTVEDLKHRRIGHLRIAATPQLGNTIVPSAIASLREDHPQVRVVLDVRQSSYVIQSVETGVAEIGLALALGNRLERTVTLHDLGEVDMVCVVPSEHRFSCRDFLTARDLETEIFIGLDLDTLLGKLVKKAFEAAECRYSPGLEARYSETACRLADAGCGMALVDELSARSLRGMTNITVVPFRPALAVRAKAILPKGRPLSGVAELMIGELRKTAANSLTQTSPN